MPVTKTEKPIPAIKDALKSDDKKDMAKQEKARFEDDGGSQHNEPQQPNPTGREKGERR
jgi:hypothetical protein